MNSVIKNWFKRFKKYFFFYRDGFFELPYLANSPELMIESFSSMPFMNDNRQKGCFSANNLFLKGNGHYQKIEDGLWIILSEFEAKKDLSFKLYYDDDTPSDYHFLTLYIDKGLKNVKLPKLQLNVENQDQSWTLFKAGATCLNSHFKGQHSIFFSIYFSKVWLKNNIASNGTLKTDVLNAFFDSAKECIFLPNLLDYKKEVYNNIVDSILDKDENGIKNLLLLKSRTYDIIASFVEALEKKSGLISENILSERDRRLVLRAQHILHESIFDKFPSITNIAAEVGVSETKIKVDFKTVLGDSMYQYFVKKQMNYALEILKNKDLSIKEVAFTLGYSNPSKFSIAFEKVHGFLPSKIDV